MSTGSRPRRSSVLSTEQQDFLERRLQNRPSESQQSMANKLQATARKLERSLISDNLNQQLYSREDIDQLSAMNSGLFKAGDVAPRLRQAKVNLERSITRDQVGHLLETRPDPDELVKAGIAQSAALAPGIQSMSRRLERSMTQDRVGHLLEQRSDMDDLQQSSVLRDVRVAPAIQGQQRELEKNLARSNLYHALKFRPSVVELVEKGLYPEEYLDGYDYTDGYYDEDYDEDEYGAEQEMYEDEQGMYEEEQMYEDEEAYEEEQAYYEQQEPAYDRGYQRRSKNFHLTRILLKFVASMGEAGELTVEQKGFLKDLIVDQDQTILAVAETFDAENDLHDFKDSLVRLASRC